MLFVIKIHSDGSFMDWGKVHRMNYVINLPAIFLTKQIKIGYVFELVVGSNFQLPSNVHEITMLLNSCDIR
ncbi:MAG: hypothetical protein P8O16_18590 [Algoriphagus sp.]|uniref:hypothetical protein n=1 Tax=Algoriphagus sp. TaxID=1872435 RepID=UPI00260BBB11|nr:hypothetical protein [Algoriphagus sp.]MDG1279294.1 hypothetical protein [Algoriphagus sp.]